VDLPSSTNSTEKTTSDALVTSRGKVKGAQKTPPDSMPSINWLQSIKRQPKCLLQSRWLQHQSSRSTLRACYKNNSDQNKNTITPNATDKTMLTQ
jgi:hypothetical protein